MHQHTTLLPGQQASRPGLALSQHHRPARHCTRPQASGRSGSNSSEGSSPSTSFPDPEAKFRRYGKYFGGGFRLDGDTWWQVPRVRIRQAAQRQKDELLELAVLNERLSGGMAPWQARNRLEQLRMRRRNWEAIYDYVTKTDAAATLALIEEANEKAELLLSEEEAERASVSDLKERLTDLQAKVDQASQRLVMTQQRVEHNLQRVSELKAEAAMLERLKETASAEPAYASASTSSGAPAGRANTNTFSSSRSSSVSSSKSSRSSSGVASQTAMRATSTAATPPAAPAAARQQPSQPKQQQQRRNVSERRRERGLSSSLDIEDGLREFWYPAEFSSGLKKDLMVPFELLGQPWVLFRDESGRPACVRDECAHRACPLSLGKVVDGKVACAYHGWEFNGAGECTKMPSTAQCSHVGVAALPCAEKDGFVWVWPGHGAPPEVPASLAPPEGFEVHSEIVIDVPVEHGLLMENLLDLAHAPFTHTTTFARGWPIPDVVKFHAQQLLSGSWDPYPIDMAFQPPCSVLSRVGLAQPGKIMRGVRADACERHLHQLHVCAPAKKGHTRLLYRMSLDFMPWAKHVPFVDLLWRKVADQVLGEDLVLVLGQQDRLSRGGDTWANPVSYDKLAVRYRRWRNAVAAEGRGSGPEAADALVSMSAGELFAPTEPIADARPECWTGDEDDAEQECSVDAMDTRQLMVAAASAVPESA